MNIIIFHVRVRVIDNQRKCWKRLPVSSNTCFCVSAYSSQISPQYITFATIYILFRYNI